MNAHKNRTFTLVTALAMATVGCSGGQGPAGPAGATGSDGGVVVSKLAAAGLKVVPKGVTVNPDKTVSVRFLVTDDAGTPVDLAGKYSTNAVMAPLFSLSQVNVAADGVTMLPYTVLTKSASKAYTTTAPDPATLTLNPTAINPVNYADPKEGGALVENGSGAGDYTYTFPVGGTYPGGPGAGRYLNQNVVQVTTDCTVDPTSTNTYAIWIEVGRQTNTTNTDDAKGFKAVNVEYDFVPSNPTATIVKRQVAATTGCSKCHNAFKPEGSVKAAFHSGTRVEAAYCGVCHNPARISTATNSDGTTPAAAAAIFVHRIHASKELQAANIFDNVGDVTYPQDLRNCDACHQGATQGAQAKSTANRAVCGSCHDYVVFDPAKVGSLTACVNQVTGAEAQDINGNWLPCVHSGAANIDDTTCKGCHVAGGSGFIGDKHVAAAPPNPASILVPVTSGTATAGYPVAAVCTAGAPCTCTAANLCYNPDYVFVTSGTVADGYYSSTGVKCTAAAPCACGATTPCFSNPFSTVTTGTATSGFLVVKANACTVAVPCTCSVGTPCVGVGSSSTNGASVAAAGALPAGAIQISYNVKSVSRNASKQPVIVFKLQQTVGGTTSDVTFNVFDPTQPTPGQELMANFVGSPSVYFAFAVPQDGITAPADFNASTSTYIRSVWNNTATTTSVGTMTGPDSSGFYTITITGSVIPDNAVMLTGGVGYTYSLTTTPPLTQTNLLAYPYDPVTRIGGLVVPAPDKWVVGTSYTGRRAIVDNAKCNNCHVLLGANPTFHAGQRNDGPTCSFCHNANQNNSGWAGNAKDFIHGLHAGTLAGIKLPDGTASAGSGVRTVPFGWHAISASEGYWEVTFPGQHNYCEACHASGGTYDFSAAASAAAVPNLLSSTAGTGTLAAGTLGASPYVTVGTNYGSGFGYAKDTGIATQAAATTLVVSPITAACVACHDSPAAKGHMVGNGGLFYSPRSTLTLQAAEFIGESCLVCHGVGAIAPIADVHQ